MTDLERAQTLINDFVSGLLPTPPFPQMIANALATARREALEAAAQIADGYCTDRTDDVATAIRKLKEPSDAPAA